MTAAASGFITLTFTMLVGCSNAPPPRPADSLRTAGQADAVLHPSTAASASSALRIATLNATDTTEIGGEWRSALEASSWTAFAIGGRIVRLQETSRDTSTAPFVRQFHFDGYERLAHYVEDRSQLAAESNASPRMMRVHTEVEWPEKAPANTPASASSIATRQVDGVARPVQPWDIDNILRHADQLLSLARPGVPRP